MFVVATKELKAAEKNLKDAEEKLAKTLAKVDAEGKELLAKYLGNGTIDLTDTAIATQYAEVVKAQGALEVAKAELAAAEKAQKLAQAKYESDKTGSTVDTVALKKAQEKYDAAMKAAEAMPEGTNEQKAAKLDAIKKANEDLKNDKAAATKTNVDILNDANTAVNEKLAKVNNAESDLKDANDALDKLTGNKQMAKLLLMQIKLLKISLRRFLMKANLI